MTREREQEIADLVRDMVEAVIEGEAAIDILSGEHVLVLSAIVDQGDMRLILGKHGATVDLFRQLVGKIGGKHNRRIRFEVVEPDRGEQEPFEAAGWNGERVRA